MNTDSQTGESAAVGFKEFNSKRGGFGLWETAFLHEKEINVFLQISSKSDARWVQGIIQICLINRLLIRWTIKFLLYM
jgi:hypothetical protein